jgi:hypothetical protein
VVAVQPSLSRSDTEDRPTSRDVSRISLGAL